MGEGSQASSCSLLGGWSFWLPLSSLCYTVHTWNVHCGVAGSPLTRTVGDKCVYEVMLGHVLSHIIGVRKNVITMSCLLCGNSEAECK